MQTRSTLFAATLIASLLTGSSLQALTLTVFEWEGYILPYADEFTAYAKEKGMDVTLAAVKKPDGQPRYISNADDIFQVARRGEADIVTPTHNYFKDSSAKLMKLLHPVDFARLSNHGSVVGSLQKPAFAEEGGKYFAVPLTGGGYSLAYNADRVKDAPTSWTTLSDPKYKGRTSITNGQVEANVYVAALLSGTAPDKIYRYDTIDPAKTEAILKGITANSPVYWEALPDPEKMAKDLDIITDYGFSVVAANASGQNWKFAETVEPTTVWLDTISITSKAGEDPEKLKAAHLLLDFMLSPAIQGKMGVSLGTVMPNVKAAEGLPADQQGKVRIATDAFFKPELLWQPLDERTRNGYKQMWERAAGK